MSVSGNEEMIWFNQHKKDSSCKQRYMILSLSWGVFNIAIETEKTKIII